MITKPDDDEIEVSIFGPGYGECIVIHLGSGKWAIIDSCLDEDQEPVSLSYLRKLEVSLETDVVSVSASHWHDDHVRGLAKTIEACKNAQLSFGAALDRDEFLAYLELIEKSQAIKLAMGAKELKKCLDNLNGSGRQPKKLLEDTLIFDYSEDDFDHRQRVELRALSPSNMQYDNYLQYIKSLIYGGKWKAEGKIVSSSRNDLSVAMLLTIGSQGVLLGADLQQLPDPLLGWNAVVGNRREKLPLSHIFKIPHHGSSNAHNVEVWNEMIATESYSVVTPMKNGKIRLPKISDIRRIKRCANKFFITSSHHVSLNKRYQKNMRSLQETNIKPKSALYFGGRVTMRWPAKSDSPVVEVKLFDGAKDLSADKQASLKVH